MNFDARVTGRRPVRLFSILVVAVGLVACCGPIAAVGQAQEETSGYTTPEPTSGYYTTAPPPAPAQPPKPKTSKAKASPALSPVVAVAPPIVPIVKKKKHHKRDKPL